MSDTRHLGSNVDEYTESYKEIESVLSPPRYSVKIPSSTIVDMYLHMILLLATVLSLKY